MLLTNNLLYSARMALCAAGLLVSSMAFAQDKASSGGSEESEKPTSITQMIPTLTPVSDYSGDFGDRYTLLGDFNGARQDLYSKGIALDATFTQVYQGVSSGGTNDDDYKYHGLLEYGVSLDTDKLGWWPGGVFVANVYTSVGRTILGDTGSIIPVNFNSALPTADPSDTFPMEYYLTQGLPTETLVTIGRLNASNFLDRSRFSNDRKSQFLNAALGNNLLVGNFLSFSTYALLVVQPVSENVAIYGAVFEPNLQADDYQPDNGSLFSDVGAGGGADIRWELGDGLGGSLNPVFIWTNKDTTDIDNPYYPLSPLDDVVLPINAPQKSSNWTVIATLDQYLWKPAGATKKSAAAGSSVGSLPDPAADFAYQEPGLGLTVRAGYAPEEGNIWNSYFSVALSGRGVIPGRPYDRIGVGAFAQLLSDDWNDLVLVGDVLDDEVGVEAFYNYAISPALTLTADVQWIDPGIKATDNTWVLGTRLFTRF